MCRGLWILAVTYLVDFVRGIGGSGFTPGASSLKLCGGPTCL
jgi:hypothetical protein